MDAWTLSLIDTPGSTATLTTLFDWKKCTPFLTLNGASLKKEVIMKRFTVIVFGSDGAFGPGKGLLHHVWRQT